MTVATSPDFSALCQVIDEGALRCPKCWGALSGSISPHNGGMICRGCPGHPLVTPIEADALLPVLADWLEEHDDSRAEGLRLASAFRPTMKSFGVAIWDSHPDWPDSVRDRVRGWFYPTRSVAYLKLAQALVTVPEST